MPKGQRDRKKQGIATGKREATRIKRAPTYNRQRGRRTDPDNNKLLDLLKPSEADVMKLLAAQTHIGRRKCHVNMRRYTWKRRQDGVHIINLEKTWAKIILAARILVTVKDPSDIAVMSTRTIGQRGAIKFAHYTGATAMVGKWVPGTFTNPRNKRAFTEPRVIIVDEPTTCFGVWTISISGNTFTLWIFPSDSFAILRVLCAFKMNTNFFDFLLTRKWLKFIKIVCFPIFPKFKVRTISIMRFHVFSHWIYTENDSVNDS